MRRTKYDEVCKRYIERNCNEKGEQKTNLSKDELKGLISLKKKIRDKKLVVMATDKSNKLAITTLENYKSMGEVHTARDRKISRR